MERGDRTIFLELLGCAGSCAHSIKLTFGCSRKSMVNLFRLQTNFSCPQPPVPPTSACFFDPCRFLPSSLPFPS